MNHIQQSLGDPSGLVWSGSPVAIAVLDADRRYQAANPAFCRLLEVDEDELKRWPYERVSAADDLDPELDAFVRLAEGAPSTSYRRRYHTARGAEIPAVVHLCPGPAGGTLQFVIPDAVASPARPVVRAWTSLAEIGAALAHDAQEPVRVLGSHLSVLEERLPPDLEPRVRASLETAAAAAQRLRHQLRGLVQFARLGSPVIDPAPVGLEPLLALALQEGVAEAPVIEIHAGVALRCDRHQVAQALAHLLRNSVAFARAEAPPAVRIASSLVAGHPTLSVADNGRGIEPADQPRLFRLFSTLRRDGKHGAGVGLALCRAVAEGHGGRAWLESLPGSGTTVHLSFPNP
jgi:signal transduction histidine kinase